MLDIQTGATAPPDSSTPPIEFLTIQLMPLAEGGILASLRATPTPQTQAPALAESFFGVIKLNANVPQQGGR